MKLNSELFSKFQYSDERGWHQHIPSSTVVPGVLDVHSKIPLFGEPYPGLHVFRTGCIDDVWRVSPQTAALLSRIRIPRDAGSIGIDGAAGIVQGGVADAGRIRRMERPGSPVGENRLASFRVVSRFCGIAYRRHGNCLYQTTRDSLVE